MRISETKVVQLVDSEPPQVVFIDDVTGAEIAMVKQDVERMLVAVGYFDAAMGGLTWPHAVNGELPKYELTTIDPEGGQR